MIELQRKKLKFKLDGQEYSLNYPSVGMFEELNARLATCEKGKELGLTIEFLEMLGLDKGVAKSMEMDHLQMIVEQLSGQKKS